LQTANPRSLKRAGPAPAPAGGITIAGKDYGGGEFIPDEEFEKATEEQKKQIVEHKPATGRQAAGAAKWEGKEHAGVAALRGKIAEHKGGLSPEDLQKAMGSYRAAKANHGEYVIHRIDELIDEDTKKLAKVPDDKKDLYRRRLAAYHVWTRPNKNSRSWRRGPRQSWWTKPDWQRWWTMPDWKAEAQQAKSQGYIPGGAWEQMLNRHLRSLFPDLVEKLGNDYQSYLQVQTHLAVEKYLDLKEQGADELAARELALEQLLPRVESDLDAAEPWELEGAISNQAELQLQQLLKNSPSRRTNSGQSH
jgi:hypothetical protein